MTIPQSQRKVDGGKIKGSADVPNTIEYLCLVTLPNGKTSHFAFNGHYTTAPADMQVLAGAAFTAIKNAFTTNFTTLMPASTSFTAVHVRDMTSHFNPVFIGTGTAGNGTGAEDPMPSDVAAVLTENVAVRGKGAKGRMYIGGWTELANAGAGLMTSATQTALNTFGSAIDTFIRGQSQTPCVPRVARQQYIGLDGANHPARAASFTPVTSYICADLEWDTQRRRGR